MYFIMVNLYTLKLLNFLNGFIYVYVLHWKILAIAFLMIASNCLPSNNLVYTVGYFLS